MQDPAPLILAAVAVAVVLSCTLLPGVVAWLWAVVRRRDKPALLGPLFWYELTRLARSGVMPRWRVAYSTILLVGLLATYLNEFAEVNPIRLIFGFDERFPIDRMSQFAGLFLQIFLYCQLAAVVLIAPVYAGGAIAEEKDRGTLDYLQQSMLSNREIIAAKLSARVLYMLALMATGMPILSLTFLFGGVSPEILLEGFVIAVMTTLSLTSLGVWLGVARPTMREVLYWSYGTTLFVSLVGVCCFCIPQFSFLAPFTATYLLHESQGGNWKLDHTGIVAGNIATHGFLAMLFTFLATRGIRNPAPAWRGTVKRPRRTARDEQIERRRPPPARRSFRVPRLLDDDPLVWKERFFSGRVAGFEKSFFTGVGAILAGLILFPVGLGLFVALVNAATGNEVASILNPIAQFCGYAATLGLAPYAGFRLATSVSRERERQTLIGLLMLPVSRTELLAAKLKVVFLRVRWFYLPIAVMAMMAVLSGGIHPIGLLAVSGVSLSFLAFAATLGLWLSVRCGTSARAATWLIGVLAGCCLVPVLVAVLARSCFQFIGLPDDWCELARTFALQLSPPVAVYQSLYSSRYTVEYEEKIILIVSAWLASLCYLAAAGLAWRRAVKRFENEGRN